MTIEGSGGKRVLIKLGPFYDYGVIRQFETFSSVLHVIS